MGYSQHFHDSITVRGSRNVNYPASQNGGSMTVSFSETEPVDIEVYVETAPFDSSVHHCNASIDMLTGSVAAMNGAQCEAINRTAENVSNTVINGFFSLIKTEISQQLQALDSGIKADQGLLTEQAKAVSAQKDVMERDYRRISERYVQVFSSLDSECYKRIYALDKNSFNLSEGVQKKLLAEIPADETAKLLLSIRELGASKMLILISAINKKTQGVLQTLYSYITQDARLRSLIDSFLHGEGAPEKKSFGRTQFYLPAIYVLSASLSGNTHTTEVFIPGGFLNESQKAEASGKIEQFFAGENNGIAMTDEEKERLDKAFRARAEKYFSAAPYGGGNTRVYDTMMRLWEGSGFSGGLK